MENVTMLWFHNWCQDNLDSDRESFFKDIYGSHIFERLTSMKQEGQTKMEPCSKEMETSTMSLKERTNILKLKQMLHKTLNEVDKCCPKQMLHKIFD